MSIQPESIGLSSARLLDVRTFLTNAARTGQIPGAALLVGRHGVPTEPICVGNMGLNGEGSPIAPDAIFLVASVTKPYTVAAAMLLVERGEITLDDPVAQHIPEFAEEGKEGVLIRHLMTHTSGLPDMLPDNLELRQLNTPLDEFARRVNALPLDFAPETSVQYQSMGILALAKVVEAITGMSLPVFLHREFFVPMAMEDTSLGWDETKADRIPLIDIPDEQVGQDWGWNTPYWRGLGAPWGGLFTTVTDQFRWMQVFMQPEASQCPCVLAPATAAAMTRDQTSCMPSLPAAQRLTQPWGLGWRLAVPGAWSGYFGGLLSPGAYGHGGATGTVVWNDPARELTCVLFTTQPRAGARRLLGKVSNMVSACTL